MQVASLVETTLNLNTTCDFNRVLTLVGCPTDSRLQVFEIFGVSTEITYGMQVWCNFD